VTVGRRKREREKKEREGERREGIRKIREEITYSKI